MLCDTYRRKIDYLRVSVTPHCNLRCLYCVPATGAYAGKQDEYLRCEEIVRVAKILARMGIKKIRLTGGEPLVRPDIVRIAGELAAIPGVEELALSTNGILLAPLAAALKKAGVARVNISLDSQDPEKFSAITRGGALSKVWEGVWAALEAGLHPVKLNVVILRGWNDGEIPAFAALTLKFPLHVRFIELMPKGSGGFFSPEHFMGVGEAQSICEVLGPLLPQDTAGNGPARMLGYRGAPGGIGFIGAMTRCFCDLCNRLRLTASGVLRPCLDWEEGVDLKRSLRNGASDETLEGLIRLAVLAKPKAHNMGARGLRQELEPMCAIGG